MSEGMGKTHPKHRDEILDLVRGLSALAVLLAHVRAFTLCGMGEVTHPGLMVKAFYFCTGIHHQAVLVFFVLSGYFVGGSVLQSMGGKGFSTSRYALARLSRLWTVLVPALILTLCADFVGVRENPGAYHGTLHDVFSSGPTNASPARWDGMTFFGNLFFLQTIATSVYGTNGPLWSLANEFWYYVLFPFGACGIRCLMLGKRLSAALLLAAFAGIAWGLPVTLVASGGIWLFGAGVWWIASKPNQAGIFQNAWWRMIFGAIFFGTLAATKTKSPLGNDWAVGLAFAAWMPSLLGPWKDSMLPCDPLTCILRRLRVFSRWISTALSDLSYTLYVAHFPVLFLAGTAWLHGARFQPNRHGLVVFGVLSASSLGISTLMWYLFERRTGDVRDWLSSVFLHTPRNIPRHDPQ